MSDVNPWISQDTWFEILKELPVKTLGKCRCVCKSWNSLIVSRGFMAAHLKHYTQNEANSLLLCKGISERNGYEQCVIVRNSVQFMEGKSSLHNTICPFLLDEKLLSRFHIIGSIYGLLCLSDHAYLGVADRIMIWNPLLQKSIKVSLSSTDDERSVLGFGYDDRKNDHRVVKISQSLVKNGATATTPLIEIYSVQERTWRTISGDYLVHNSIRDISSSQCFINGSIHWLVLESLGVVDATRSKWALLFDVVEETFNKMELPDSLATNGRGGCDFGIFEYKGNLSVSLSNRQLCDNEILLHCQIWVKREYSVKSSWCKIWNVFINDCSHMGPMQYLERDEELVGLTTGCTGEFLSYDSKTKQTKALGRHVSAGNSFTAYSVSLVLLDQEIDALTQDELQRTFRDVYSNLCDDISAGFDWMDDGLI